MKVFQLSDGAWGFYCPGCHMHHCVDSRWTFDGNIESPTFSPSLLNGPWWRLPHGWDENTAPRDADGNLKLHADGTHLEGAFEACCHLFIRNGMLEFLSDCTHELAGQTVPMEDTEE